MKRITFTFPWPLSGVDTREILFFSCQVAWLSYLIGFIAENLDPGSIVPYFDLNIFLWVAIFFAAASSIWSIGVRETRDMTKRHWFAISWVAILTLGVAVAVWHLTADIGQPALLVAPIAGLAVLGLCLLAYYDGDEDPTSI